MYLYTEFGELYSILRDNGYEEILNDNQIFDGGFSNLEKFKNLLSNQNFDNLTNEQLNVINNFRTLKGSKYLFIVFGK